MCDIVIQSVIFTHSSFIHNSTFIVIVCPQSGDDRHARVCSEVLQAEAGGAAAPARLQRSAAPSEQRRKCLLRHCADRKT